MPAPGRDGGGGGGERELLYVVSPPEPRGATQPVVRCFDAEQAMAVRMNLEEVGGGEGGESGGGSRGGGGNTVLRCGGSYGRAHGWW